MPSKPAEAAISPLALPQDQPQAPLLQDGDGLASARPCRPPAEFALLPDGAAPVLPSQGRQTELLDEPAWNLAAVQPMLMMPSSAATAAQAAPLAEPGYFHDPLAFHPDVQPPGCSWSRYPVAGAANQHAPLPITGAVPDRLGMVAGPLVPARRPRQDRSIDIMPALDVSTVELPGDKYDRVAVFDTCDMIRNKIRAFLRKPGMTQAAFLRALAATYSDGRRLQGAQLHRFLSMRGPHSGNTSGIFYAAYVFFEKVRVRDGKPKTADRFEMEKHYPGGFNVSEIKNPTYIWGLKGDRFLGFDKYGLMRIDRARLGGH